MTSRMRMAALLPMTFVWLLLARPVAAVQPSPFDTTTTTTKSAVDLPEDVRTEIRHVFLRLPLAALLGTMLAMRPRRRGTPPRKPAVIQTQIILAIVGAMVMLVVGSNLARAFGVVGAAGLVRYRAKVEDPKDAGVMLSTLGVGLASGVGQYVMATVSGFFILLALWIIESFEPDALQAYILTIKMGDDTDGQMKQFEAILKRHHVDFTLQSASDEEVCYEAQVPLELDRDRITTAMLKLDPEGHASVQWAEKKPAKAK